MAVSTQSAPASMAFIRLTSVTPVVAWVCTCTRTCSQQATLGSPLDPGQRRPGLQFAGQIGKQVARRLRPAQPRHVLDAQRVAAHLHQALRQVDVSLHGMQGTHRVADGALGMLAVAAHGLDRVRDVAQVVQRIEDAEHVHAVLSRLVDEAVDDLVLVVPVAQQVLAAQQHLQLRMGHQLAEAAQALPRVFVEEADAGIEGGAAPAFHRPIARGVDVGAGRHHVLEGHARGQQALVGIAQGELGDVDGLAHCDDVLGKN